LFDPVTRKVLIGFMVRARCRVAGMRILPLVFLGLAACGARTPLEVNGGDGGVDASFDAALPDAALSDGALSSNRICKPGEAPSIIASGQSHPYAIVVDTDRAYWTNTGVNGTNLGSVRSAPLLGGAALTLAMGEDAPRGIAIDDTSVYFARSQFGEIVRVPKTGGAIDVLAAHQDFPEGVALRDGTLYWTTSGTTLSGALTSLVPGGATTTLAAQLANPAGLFVDATHVYWVDQESRGSGPGQVLRVARVGGAPEVLASGIATPFAVVVRDGRVFWSANDSVGALDLGGPATVLAARQFFARGIAVDEGFVYWADAGAGTVNKTPVRGGTITTIASGESSPMGVAVDDSCVYWTSSGLNDGSGMVKRAPR
jgi:hypothetical protein